MEHIWDRIVQCLKDHLSSPGFQTFLSSAKPISFENHILTIEVPSAFSKEWIRDKCESILRDQLSEIGYDVIFHYRIAQATEPSSDEKEQLSIFSPPKASPPPLGIFNPKYDFDSFVNGHNNRFAQASAEAVAKTPAKAYNPLFIYGSVGLGKTHLLHAIGHRIHQQFPSLKIKLVSCEKFTNDLINAIKDKKTEQFRAKYRTPDVLLVDDIQFLSGKEQTQEEFFHTFNDLYSKETQIVIASDRPPKEIPTLEDRLRTRFEWGLIADIQAPEFETRIAILRKKTEANQLDISDEILHYIATQIPSNVREMEGALTRIVAYASLLNTEVTLEIASKVIQDIVGIRDEKPLTTSQIQQKTCDYFNISTADLISKSRQRDIAYARQIAMYLSRELTNMSLLKIGESFGNRDHSTVMHAVDKIKSKIKEDGETKNIINVLISEIKS